jgi:hypothetical protein
VIIKSKDLIRSFVTVIESHVANVFFPLLFGRCSKNGMLPALAGFLSFSSGTHRGVGRGEIPKSEQVFSLSRQSPWLHLSLRGYVIDKRVKKR